MFLKSKLGFANIGVCLWGNRTFCLQNPSRFREFPVKPELRIRVVVNVVVCFCFSVQRNLDPRHHC